MNPIQPGAMQPAFFFLDSTPREAMERLIAAVETIRTYEQNNEDPNEGGNGSPVNLLIGSLRSADQAGLIPEDQASIDYGVGGLLRILDDPWVPPDELIVVCDSLVGTNGSLIGILGHYS